jgi:hypothetical protein
MCGETVLAVAILIQEVTFLLAGHAHVAICTISIHWAILAAHRVIN